MNQLVPITSPILPALVAAGGESASMRFLEFFAANLATRTHGEPMPAPPMNFWPGARAPACRRSAPCSRCMSLPGSRPARASSRRRASSNGSPRSAICSTGSSPARSCRSTRQDRCAGPGTSQRAGKRRCSIRRKRALLDSIDVSTHAGLRDRALIALMVYSFARIGPAVGMAVEDVFTQNRRLWVRLREKGGKRHAMPCHHNLEEYLTAYLDGAGLRVIPTGRCFERSAAAARRRIMA
jgi:integrase/recombinase XerC